MKLTDDEDEGDVEEEIITDSQVTIIDIEQVM